MKLLLCIECRDVRRIQPERTHCQCGKAWANHDNGSDRNVVANEQALILTLPNSELTSALHRKTNAPAETQGVMTFLCPEPCKSVRRVREAKR